MSKSDIYSDGEQLDNSGGEILMEIVGQQS